MTRRRETGLSLTVALVTLLAVSAAVAALLASTERTARSDASARDGLAARWAAEAGVERARWALGRDPSYAGETLRFDAFDVSIEAAAPAEGRFAVRAVAAGRGRRACVVADLAAGDGLPSVECWSER